MQNLSTYVCFITFQNIFKKIKCLGSNNNS